MILLLAASVLTQHLKPLQVRENNGEIRDEITKQLDRSVANDWKYQIDFKKKRAEDAKLAEMNMAQREKQAMMLYDTIMIL